MKWEKLGTSKLREAKLKGIELEFDIRNETCHGITLKDHEGAILRLAGDYSSVHVMVPAKPKMVKRYRLSGILHGLGIMQEFEVEATAKRKRDEILAKVVDGSMDNLTVEEFEIPEPE